MCLFMCQTMCKRYDICHIQTNKIDVFFADVFLQMSQCNTSFFVYLYLKGRNWRTQKLKPWGGQCVKKQGYRCEQPLFYTGVLLSIFVFFSHAIIM